MFSAKIRLIIVYVCPVTQDYIVKLVNEVFLFKVLRKLVLYIICLYLFARVCVFRCIRVCVSVCECVCELREYVYMYACVRICVYVHMYKRVCVSGVCVCSFVHRLRVCSLKCTVYVYVYVCLCMFLCGWGNIIEN